MGYHVATVNGGKTGHVKALSWVPDIIISDICMEDMAGTELFAVLRSRTGIFILSL